MKSFLEGEEIWETEHWVGFDPDLHRASLVILTVQTSNKSRKLISDFNHLCFSIPNRLKGLDAVQMTIEVITQHIKEVEFIDYAIVESQQSYYKDSDTRAKIVGQANDLIMLATISGAAAALFMARGADVFIKRPAAWKGQRKKVNMHNRAKALLVGQKQIQADRLDELDKMCEHEMDALCMALRGAGYHV